MQDFSKRIGLVTSLHQVTGYSSVVNGKNLGFTAAAMKRFVMAKEKIQIPVSGCQGEEALYSGEDCCSLQQRENICLYPSFK